MTRLVLVVGAVVALMSASPASADIGGPAIVKKLNALRAKVGIPPVQHSARQTAGCRAHDRWMDLNRRLQHEQIPGTPGASKEGAAAGITSVLSQGPSWRRQVPWINAPIHLMAILNPQHTVYGGYELTARGRNWNCLGPDNELSGRDVTVERFYAWPPTRDVPAQQRAYEAPYAPQEKMGYRRNAVTGPNILLWWTGPVGGLAPKSARLTAGGRAVPVKLGADVAQFPGVHEIGYGYGEHAFVVPPKLKAGVKHVLEVTWALPADQVGAYNCPRGFDWANGDVSTCPIAVEREAVQRYVFTPKAYRLEQTGTRVSLKKKTKKKKAKKRPAKRR